jgi:hypothetical protein
MVALLALVALSLVGLGASGLLRFGAPKSEPQLQAKSQAPPSLLQARAFTSDTNLSAPAPARTEMPADIKAWLEHLQAIERRRVEMTNDHLSKMFVTMATVQGAGALEMLQGLMNPDGPDLEPTAPHQRFAEDLAPLKDDWARLLADFNAIPPPAECVPIRHDYDQAVRETSGMIGDLIDVLSQPIENKEQQSAAVQALMRWKGKSNERIGEPARRADQALAAVCEKYSTPKWFSIAADIGDDSVLRRGLGF